MKYTQPILLIIIVIFTSCSKGIYPLNQVKNKYPKTPSEAIPQDVFQNMNLNYTFYSSGKIRLSGKPFEMVLFLNGVNTTVTDQSLKRGVVSILDSKDSIAPSLDIFHNSTVPAGIQTFVFNNAIYEFKVIIGNQPKLLIKKLKKDLTVIPDMTFDLRVPKTLMVYEFVKNQDQLALGGILDKINQDTILINFWNVNCAGCFEKIPRLNKIYSDNKYGLININSSSNSDKDALNLFNKYPFPGINLKSKIFIEKYFDQNGYPYYCLLDKRSLKVIKSWVGNFELY